MAEYQNIFTRVQVRPDHPHMGVPLEQGVWTREGKPFFVWTRDC